MAYVEGNPKTKKELKQWLAEGREVYVYQPGPFGPDVKDGSVALEGPHYPKPHSWYASGIVYGGRLVSIK
jgi:hypothetical protein